MFCFAKYVFMSFYYHFFRRSTFCKRGSESLYKCCCGVHLPIVRFLAAISFSLSFQPGRFCDVNSNLFFRAVPVLISGTNSTQMTLTRRNIYIYAPAKQFMVCDRCWLKSNIIMLELCRLLNVCVCEIGIYGNTLHYIIVNVSSRKWKHRPRRIRCRWKILLSLLCPCLLY